MRAASIDENRDRLFDDEVDCVVGVSVLGAAHVVCSSSCAVDASADLDRVGLGTKGNDLAHAILRGYENHHSQSMPLNRPTTIPVVVASELVVILQLTTQPVQVLWSTLPMLAIRPPTPPVVATLQTTSPPAVQPVMA